MTARDPKEVEQIAVAESELSDSTQEQFSGSTMSKAGKTCDGTQCKERKRLKQEMEELQLEVEDLKPATPTGTVR